MTVRWRRARSRSRRDNRADTVGASEPELQGSVGAHAKTNNMGTIDAEPIHHSRHVIDRAFPPVGRRILRDIARRIATGIVRDAAIGPRKITNLVFPLSKV